MHISVDRRIVTNVYILILSSSPATQTGMKNVAAILAFVAAAQDLGSVGAWKGGCGAPVAVFVVIESMALGAPRPATLLPMTVIL